MGSSSKQVSSNPPWLDKAGEEAFNFAKSYFFPGQQTGGGGAPQTGTSGGNTPGAGSGGSVTSSTPNYSQYGVTGDIAKLYGLNLDPRQGGMPAGLASSGGGGGGGGGAPAGAMTMENLRAPNIYEGQRVANLNDNYKQAFATALGAQGKFGHYFDRANGLIDDATQGYGQTFDPSKVNVRDMGVERFAKGALNPFMSDYAEAALAPGARRIAEQADKDLNAVKAREVSAGAFGGSRGALLEAENRRDLQTNLGDYYAQGMDRAYNTALGAYDSEQGRVTQGALANLQKNVDLGKYNEDQRLRAFDTNFNVFNTDANRKLQGASQLGTLAGQRSQIVTDNMNRMLTAGEAQRNFEQQKLDAAKARFDERANYEKDTMSYLMGLLNGNPSAGAMQTVQKPSVGSQLLGAGTALGSAYLMCSRKFKYIEGAVREDAILEALDAVPVMKWRYLPEMGEGEAAHISPMAEDFADAFEVGDGVTIHMADAIGVMFASIQALNRKVAALEAENAKLKGA